MRMFKRILLYAAIVISIVVMVVCIAGMIGAWYYNTPATDAVLGIVDPVTEAVQVAETVTDEAGMALQDDLHQGGRGGTGALGHCRRRCRSQHRGRGAFPDF